MYRKIVLNYGKVWTCWLFDPNTFYLWFSPSHFQCPNWKNKSIWKVFNDFENPSKKLPEPAPAPPALFEPGPPFWKRKWISITHVLFTYILRLKKDFGSRGVPNQYIPDPNFWVDLVLLKSSYIDISIT